MHALPALNAQGASLQNRALVICLAASLLLHAALLFLLPGMREGGQSASATQILTATFAPRTSQPAPAPVKEVAPQRPQPPKPEPQPQRPPPKVEAPRPVLTAPATAPAPVIPQPPPPPVAAVPESPPVTPAPPPAVASAPRPAEPAAPLSTAPPRPPAEAADAGSLAQYRMDLILTANKYYKRYPAQAMEKGWQGRVEVRLQIGTNGMIKASSIKSSSGYEVLDKQALDMITKAKGRLITVPPALRGKEFVVDVPVIFDLQSG